MPRSAHSLPTNVLTPGWHPGPIPHLVFPEPCLDFADSLITNHARKGGIFDRMQTRLWREWFLQRWGWSASPDPTADELLDLARLRTTLRSLLESQRMPGQRDLGELNRLLSTSLHFWQVGIAASRSRPVLTLKVLPVKAGWPTVMAEIVASYARMASDGRLRHVRRCANKNCALIFYDESVNHSRRWCDPRLCGNLLKVRQHRARARPHQRRA